MLAGAIQGFVFAAVVWSSKKYKSESIFYLVALIVVFSINILEYYALDTGIFSNTAFYRYIYIPVANLVPVFLYLYTIKVLYPERKITKKQKLLYIPFVFWFVAIIVYKILVIFFPQVFSKEYAVLAPMLYFHELNCSLFIMVMALYALRKVSKFEKSNNSIDFISRKPQLLWLKLFLWSIFTLLFSFFIYAAYCDIKKIEAEYYFLWIAMAIEIYFFGHIGIYKFGIEQERGKIQEFKKMNSPKINLVKNDSEIIAESKTSKQLAFFEKFIAEEKNYLDPQISLEKSADALNVNKSYLSRILNQELNISFNDYVNKLRVEEAKNILDETEFANYTLSAIGLEAGFNSKSTFYSAFKKFTGKTPSDYQKMIKQNSRSVAEITVNEAVD